MTTLTKENKQAKEADSLFRIMKRMKDTTRFWMYEKGGIIYFFDRRTSDIFGISDSLSKLISTQTIDEFHSIIKDLSKDEIIEHIEFLSDMLNITDAPVQCNTSNSHISVLKLNISSQCNLSCAYCFREKKHNVALNDSRLIYRAIDAMVNDFGKDAPSYTVCFNLASEPLIYPELMNDIYAYIKKLKAHIGKRIELFFITNGTILSDTLLKTIKKIRKDRPVSISIDGPKDVHDALRRYPDGNGSYDTIIKNIQVYKKKGFIIAAEGVITNKYPYPFEIIKHLMELGFESINIKPVRQGTPFSFDEKSIETLKKGYDEYFTYLKEALIDENYFILKILCKDYAIRPLWRILFNHKINIRCGWGINQISMDHRGDFYPCDSIMGMQAYRVGNVFDGIDWNKYHRDMGCEKRGKCFSCWARHICGGTCYVNGIIGHNDVCAIDPIECTLTKYLIESNVRMICDLFHADADIEMIKKILKLNLTEIYLL